MPAKQVDSWKHFGQPWTNVRRNIIPKGNQFEKGENQQVKNKKDIINQLTSLQWDCNFLSFLQMMIINWIQYRLDFKNWQGYPQFMGTNVRDSWWIRHEVEFWIDELNTFSLSRSYQGLGRVALIALVLGSILTFHVSSLILACGELIGIVPSTFLANISEARIGLIIQWFLFAIVLCIFHLLEFFVTAMFNPTVVDASSFVVNHSKPYTIAMIVSYDVYLSIAAHIKFISIANFLEFSNQVALFEFCIRFMLFPSFNSYSAAFLGIILVSMGQVSNNQYKMYAINHQ